MGGDGWDEGGPWRDLPGESLHEVQRERVAKAYDLPAFVALHLASAREALRVTRKGSMPPGLKEHLIHVYGRDVAFLERVQAEPLPTDLAGQHKLIRRVHGADGCGGVLDVTGVGDGRGLLPHRQLVGAELVQIFGSNRPTADDVRAGRQRLPDVGRGESLCFPEYDREGTGVAWHFVGLNGD